VTASDSSVSIEYNNEDQPEANLKDLPLNSTAVISSSVTTVSSGSSGGGIFDFLLVFLSILFFRKQYFGTSKFY